jgi:superfamily II DNA or RNA helicase
MHYQKHTEYYNKDVVVDYDKNLFNIALKKRRNPWTNKPVKNASELFYLFRKIVNSDKSRIKVMKDLISKHDRLIIFYNFDYELDMLRNLGSLLNVNTKEWNGHKHEEVPETNKWIYLVQYMSGAEGCNCITTDTIVFYSQSYSYKTMIQAAGRIDRLNTPYKDLFYYYLKSESPIDIAISKALKEKKNFNVLDNSLIRNQTRVKHAL